MDNNEKLFEFSTKDAREKVRSEVKKLKDAIRQEGAKRIIVTKNGEQILDVSVSDALTGAMNRLVDPILAAARTVADVAKKTAACDFTVKLVKGGKQAGAA